MVKINTLVTRRPGVQEKAKFVVDSGVSISLLREEECHKLRMPDDGTRKLELKLSIKVEYLG